jgi:hypothetical protein
VGGASEEGATTHRAFASRSSKDQPNSSAWPRYGSQYGSVGIGLVDSETCRSILDFWYPVLRRVKRQSSAHRRKKVVYGDDFTSEMPSCMNVVAMT